MPNVFNVRKAVKQLIWTRMSRVSFRGALRHATEIAIWIVRLRFGGPEYPPTVYGDVKPRQLVIVVVPPRREDALYHQCPEHFLSENRKDLPARRVREFHILGETVTGVVYCSETSILT
jgi:hypothetical protein